MFLLSDPLPPLRLSARFDSHSFSTQSLLAPAGPSQVSPPQLLPAVHMPIGDPSEMDAKPPPASFFVHLYRVEEGRGLVSTRQGSLRLRCKVSSERRPADPTPAMHLLFPPRCRPGHSVLLLDSLSTHFAVQFLGCVQLLGRALTA
jgi:hypothetical protein